MSLKIPHIHIKGFWEERGEELRPPFNSTFHKLLLKTLPNFTITAMNITTQKAPLPLSVGKESRSSPGEWTLPARPPLQATPSQLTSNYVDWKTPWEVPLWDCSQRFWWLLNLWKWNDQQHLLDGTWKIHWSVWVGLFFTPYKFKYGAQLKGTQTHTVIQTMKTLNYIIPPVR